MHKTPAEQLLALYQNFQKKAHCPFAHEEKNHYVFGAGNPQAKLLLIGEAPGAEEERLKKPFVGRSGQLLNKIFKHFGIAREELFITNIVKCRPPHNRTPEPQEISPDLRELLLQEMSIISPRVICTLGTTATFFFLHKTATISKLRGIFYKGTHPRTQQPLWLLPTFHPSYALRSPDAAKLLSIDILNAFERSKIE